ncbi:hypothetical protein OROHE_012414 [Orobanche hederae]
MYFSIIALFSAMIVQHTYIVIIAARAAFYRYIPPDAQNKIAAFVLHHLFPDLLVHFMLLEPYASFILKWKEDLIARTGELFTTLEDEPEHRSTNFVDSLLSVDQSGHTLETDVMDSTHQEKTQMPHIVEYTGGSDHFRESLKFGSDMHKLCNGTCFFVRSPGLALTGDNDLKREAFAGET